MPPSPEPVAPGPGSERPLIAVVADRADRHARELMAALRALGAATILMRLEACGFDTRRRAGLVLDRCGDRLPGAVLVRTMAGGSFEAVTLRLGILHALRDLGVLVWNDARAIERCVDKSATSFHLARADLFSPETWATESHETARAIVAREAARGPLVLKPLFGSQGRGLRLLRTIDDVPAPSAVAGVYYLQRFIGVERDGYRDFRLFVSRGRVIAAMMRHSGEWITNIKRGGRPVAVAANEELKGLAVRAAAAVGADFAGVDILYDAEERPAVLEVNSMPAWSGLQRVTATRIASTLAADLLAAWREHAARDGREKRGATA
jgi:tetrahydromethanopterin:alpha-L-glutamate ligase